jgi:hypothetical protein
MATTADSIHLCRLGTLVVSTAPLHPLVTTAGITQLHMLPLVATVDTTLHLLTVDTALRLLPLVATVDTTLYLLPLVAMHHTTLWLLPLVACSVFTCSKVCIK